MNTVVGTHINQGANNVVCMSGCIEMQMGSKICSVVSRGASGSCCYRLQPGKSGNKFGTLSLTKSRPSETGQTPHGSCFRSCFSMDRGNSRSLTVNAKRTQKCLEISLACRGMKTRILVPRQGMLPKIKCNVGPMSWPQCAYAGLMFGLLICNSSEPAHAETTHKNDDKEDDGDLSYSHGKKVHTDYSIIGEQHILPSSPFLFICRVIMYLKPLIDLAYCSLLHSSQVYLEMEGACSALLLMALV